MRREDLVRLQHDRVWNTVHDVLPERTVRLEAFLAKQPGADRK